MTTSNAAPSIHPYMSRISHWDLNVVDLERAREWYEATTDLRVVAETSADQAFPSFGFKQGSFKGYMMRDYNNTPPYPMIHLVQWTSPETCGEVYPTNTNLGWCRIAHNVYDTAESRERVIAQGSEPFFPNGTHTNPRFHPLGAPIYYDAFCVRDPDGVINQFFGVGAAGKTGALGAALVRSPMAMNWNTANIDKHAPFYSGLLGLDATAVLQPEAPFLNIYDERGGEASFEGVMWSVRGDDRVSLDYLVYEDTRTTKPYAERNHRGLMSCTFEVDDIEACYKIMLDSDWNKEYQIVLGEPEEWDFGPQFGKRIVMNFKNPEGVYFQLMQQANPPLGKNYPNAETALHPFGAPTPGLHFED